MAEETIPSAQPTGKSAKGLTSIIKNFSLGEKIIAIGAIAGIVGFFLPWYSNPEDFAESLDISEEMAGTDIAGLAYLVPLLFIASLVILYLSAGKGAKVKIKFSFFQVLIGTVLATAGIVINGAVSKIKDWFVDELGDILQATEALSKEVEEVYHFEFGFWLLILGALAIIVGAFLVQRNNLKE